jgi:hypothetical protein
VDHAIFNLLAKKARNKDLQFDHGTMVPGGRINFLFTEILPILYDDRLTFEIDLAYSRILKERRKIPCSRNCRGKAKVL